MAAGEFVSVSSQADAEQADLAREGREQRADPAGETAELAGIYVKRGLDPVLARQVAVELMAHDAIGAHARDELGISEETTARPIQAAAASAVAFGAGAFPPVLIASLIPTGLLTVTVGGASILCLALLGALGAKTGGAPVVKATLRVTFWGAVAMAVTAGIGALFGTHVG